MLFLERIASTRSMAPGAGALLSIAALASIAPPTAAQPPVTAIEHVRVFDGETVNTDATVVLRGAMISRLGPSSEVAVPADAERVDGSGRTVFPGLIDAHTHSFADALERALDWGVTTELDMFSAEAMLPALRDQQARGEATHRADIFSAGTLVTAKGGHGTQFGQPIPTLERVEDAADFIADRVAAGADFIKVVIEDGTVVGRDIPTLDAARVAASIAAAHDHGKLAVVHVSTLAGARLALESGADGLVHIHHDGERDPAEEAALVRLALERDVFVVPTLTVLEGVTGGAEPKKMAEDPSLVPRLTESQKQGLQSVSGHGGAEGEAAFARVLARVQAMEEAGVPVLAGTDAPNPGTAHGISVHRELELLVGAGLRPVEALAAATSRSARAFRLKDRGRVAVGAKADLVLVEGDPTADITATRDIVAIWKDGVRHDPPVHGSTEKPTYPTAALGPFGRFDGSLDAPYGSWLPTTDQMAGGKSTVEAALIESGVEGSSGALEMTGELATGFGFPWSGVMFAPGAVPMSDAVDVSSGEEIVFWARAPEGPATLAVMLFTQTFGQIPRQTRIELGVEWQRYEVLFETFDSEGGDVTGVVFSAGALGPFRIQLDEVAWQ